jgi:type II secretion system protein J
MKRRGFTLIEVLLAVVLTGLIVIGSLTYLDSSRNLGDRIQFKSEMLQTARAVLSQMERDLQPAYASGQGLDWGLKGTNSVLSDLPNDSLELVAANNNPKSEDTKEIDLTRTIYRIDGERGLVRDRFKQLTNTGSATLTNSGDVICKKVVGLKFRYHDGTGWTESWDSTTLGKMPKAIEVTIHVRDQFRGEDETEPCTAAFWLPVGQTYEAPQK